MTRNDSLPMANWTEQFRHENSILQAYKIARLLRNCYDVGFAIVFPKDGVSVNDDIINFNDIPEADRKTSLIDLAHGFFDLSLVPEDRKEEVFRRLEIAFNTKGSTMDASPTNETPNTTELPIIMDVLESCSPQSTTSAIPFSIDQGRDEMTLVGHQRRGTKVIHEVRDVDVEPLSAQKNQHVEEKIEPIARKELAEADEIIQRQDTKTAQLLEWKNQNSLLVEDMERDHALQSRYLAARKSFPNPKPGNYRNSPLIEEGNSAARGGRCLADLQRMEIKPVDGDSDWFEKGYFVTINGVQRFKGISAVRKLLYMRFDLQNLEFIDQQTLSESETTF
ncbi:uncharacterized protein EAF01_007263 [Botrytis porri]|uniref:uncharacterized protein n=1 Tax=Botrytis porri TaxID=87229 RepID=UPI0019010268|nr:uncharacterized protein EAF01_007263 [Botrytis porri]KAF7901965.1 hypothetical protein EAF01_007263 [Botrytis porri]